MADTLKLKIILGSTRPTRFSEKIAPWIEERAKKRPEFEVEILDLREYEMPFFNEAETPSSKKEPYKNDAVARWTKKAGEADAFIFIAPEYDRGIPAVLKNAIDWVSPEWARKAAAYVGYGTVGGAHSIEHLRVAATELHMASVRQAVHIFEHWMLRDEKGDIKPGALDNREHQTQAMLEQLSWWARTLKYGRENIGA